MGRTKLADAYVKIDYKDLNNLDSKIDQTGRKFVDQTGKMNQSLKVMTGLIAGVGLVALGRDIIGAATKWDSMEKSLLYVEKTQANVNKRLAEFRIIAKDPGIGLQQLTQGYIGFTSAGMKMEPAIKLMRELANNMASMDKGATEIERVNYQLIQMKSKGIPQLEDLRVIQEAMPNINEIIRKAFGSTDIETLVKGGLNADKFIAGITEAMSKQERATTGARNAQDNFNDSLFQFKAALGESVLPAITDFLTKTTKLLDLFNSLSEATQKAIGTGAMVGGGLLGVGLALNTIKTALDGIGISSGMKALASVGGGAVAGKAFKPIVNPSVIGGAIGAGESVALSALMGIGKAVLPVFLVGSAIAIGGWYASGDRTPNPLGLNESKYSVYGPKGGMPIPTKHQKMSAMEDPTGQWFPRLAEFYKFGRGVKPSDVSSGMTLAEWEKTFSENPFPYTVDLSKQRVNSPFNTFDTYKGAFSGTMANFMPSRRAFSGVPQAISDLSTFNKGWQGGSGGASMAGGTVSDRSFLHQQETQWLSESYKTKLVIYEAEKAYDKADLARFEDKVDVMENSWDTFFEKNKQSVEELDRAWVNNLSTWIGIIDSASTLMIGFLGKLGMDTNSATTKHLSGMLSGAGQGVVTGAMIGSAVPVIGTVTGAVVGGIIGGVAGYDTGGIAWNPQIARVAESEPEMIMPLSKLKRNGMAELISRYIISTCQILWIEQLQRILWLMLTMMPLVTEG
jgi:tape measure domain-containing protein